MTVRKSHEQRRGCGYRKGGGYYLIGGSPFSTCEKLPYPLMPCPHCGQGMKFYRGFGWFSPQKFISRDPCYGSPMRSLTCPMSGAVPERAGLMWVGTKFYTPESFIEESTRLGLSKRLPTVPRELLKNMGNVRVYLAHPKACLDADGKPAPGIFTLFVPSRIEYVVKGNETNEELGRIEQRGIELVEVVPMQEQPDLFETPTNLGI